MHFTTYPCNTGIHMLGALGSALREIEIMQLGGLGWMRGEKLVFIREFVEFVVIDTSNSCVCLLWMAFDLIITNK